MIQYPSLLQGRRGLIVGVANERSIAHGIAKAARQAGAQLALTYQNDRFKDRVVGIGADVEAELVLPCDLTSQEQIAQTMDAVRQRWGGLDFVVHAVAHARREELEGRFIETSRDGFVEAMEASVYTFVALARAAEPLLQQGTFPTLLTLSYYGAEKAVPNYNVMGVAKAALEASVRYLARDMGQHNIRVNAISAGPIRTLSAAGVKGLRRMLDHVERDAPLRRNVSIDDVGRAALFVLSNLGSGTTGEVIHVDSGYHAVAVSNEGEG